MQVKLYCNWKNVQVSVRQLQLKVTQTALIEYQKFRNWPFKSCWV